MSPVVLAQHAGHGVMNGIFGAPMTREASGTSWQPDATPHMAQMRMQGDWHVMLHGSLDLVYDEQGGPRGDDDVFGAGMLMAAAQRPWGAGMFGVRAMLSPDAVLMGKDGYPLLLQTGETADGHAPLIDRQHPHDLFMELSAGFSHPLGRSMDHSMNNSSALFVYAGLPGEPALGPPAFMHRFSGMENPEAPLSHHWLDSTHITFGVVTAGYVRQRWKIEASMFNGREPDEERYDIEVRRLDSTALRLSVNPSTNWALQISGGRLKSPEQLEPQVDVDRLTASASYHREALGGQWQSTLAWGRNSKKPGAAPDTQALLFESALQWRQKHSVFARLEDVEKDELFDHHDPRHVQVFEVSKFSVGYLRTWALLETLHVSVGAVLSQHFTPRALDVEYGGDPRSLMLFARLSLR